MTLSVGIDIAKDKIDIYFDDNYKQIPNDSKSIKNYFKGFVKDSRFVMEATGKYHRTSHRELVKMGFDVMVVNPYQSKHFAKAMNLLCKTDRVDAKVLSFFGERMKFKTTTCPSETELELQELSRHLNDLKEIKLELENRLREASGFVSGSLKSSISSIKKQITCTEEELDKIISETESLNERVKLLVSIPGIGRTTAIVLITCIRELGMLNKKEIAALAGLAPVNNDSGTFQGRRRIKGGRHEVRASLYMPTLGAATQHNETLKKFYNRLVDAGKPKKVAITACMRKLVVWANSILASGEPWAEE